MYILRTTETSYPKIGQSQGTRRLVEFGLCMSSVLAQGMVVQSDENKFTAGTTGGLVVCIGIGKMDDGRSRHGACASI